MAFMGWVGLYRELSLQLPNAFDPSYYPMPEQNQLITRFGGFYNGQSQLNSKQVARESTIVRETHGRQIAIRWCRFTVYQICDVIDPLRAWADFF